MQFVHASVIGDFLDVLAAPSPLHGEEAEGCATLYGATSRQEAVLSRYFGRLRLENSSAFRSSLRSLLTTQVKLIVLDLSSLASLCPNCLSILVNFAAEVEAREKTLILYQPSETLRTALSDRGLDHLFRYARTPEELLLRLPD